MAPGALDPLTKEMIYLAVSVTNGCGYCIASHTAAARKAGMTDAMFGEVMAVTGMANETNRLANGYRVPIDPAFRPLTQKSDTPANRPGCRKIKTIRLLVAARTRGRRRRGLGSRCDRRGADSAPEPSRW